MMRKVFAAGVLLATGLVLTTTLQAGGKGKSDKDKLQGTWELVKMTFGDKEIPSDGKKAMLVITGNKAVMKKEGKADEESTITLDETKKPKTLTIAATGKEKEMKGIYKLEGDTMTLAMTMPGDPLPKAFDAKDAMVITLKKVKSK